MEHRLVGRLLGLLALCTATYSHDHQPSYLLLVPESVRPGVPVSLSVSVLTSSSLQVSAFISSGNQTLSSNRTAVRGESTMLLLLPPIHMDDATDRHQLVLQVHGHDEKTEVFVNKTKLHLDPKCFSTFIQMDRATYQPGEEVKIRVLTLDPHGKPYSGPVNITVSDPRGTRLRQWRHQDAVLGVVSKHFRLSDHPPLGQWRIDVASAIDVFSEKSFTVAYHVPPKFEVVIKAPKMVHQQDVLHGSVCAKYKHRKPVQGHMNITFTYYYHGMEDVLYEERMIDGEADFLFDVPDYHLLYRRSIEMSNIGGYMDDQMYVRILVHVTDHQTGVTHHSTAKVTITKFRYKLCFYSHSPSLKPSLTFSARLKITQYGGEPLTQEDLRKMVHLSVSQKKSWEREEKPETEPKASAMPQSSSLLLEESVPEEMKLPFSADGEVHLSIPISERIESLTVDAYFGDSYTSLRLSRDYTSPSNSYLSIQRPSMPLEIGKAVQLFVHSSFPLMEIHYVVKSRGQLVSAGTANTAILTLLPDFSWAPRASLIVYCVHSSGEIVSDVAQLHVVQRLRNQVSLSWSQREVEPDEDVTLRMEVVEPASLVAVLVVDTATKVAGSHNDITVDAVMKELGGSGSCAWFGSGNPHSLFQSCDLVALTDAMLPVTEPHKEKPYHEEEELPYHQKYEHDVAGLETWIWMDVFTNDSLQAEIHVTAPDTGTTWCATAFVLSKNLGLGVLQEPAELTVSQSLYASLNLPAHIVRGEELLLEVVLFNHLQVDLEVMVVVAQSDSFHFIYPDYYHQEEPLPGPSVRRILVASQSGATVLVPVRPLLIGLMPVSVKIQSIVRSQRLQKMVLVKAEGLPQSFSSSLLLDVSPPQMLLSRQFFFSFPPNLVVGSERVLVTATGDLLGPSISGLDSLVQMPYGCGEQNMINFAPNVYVLQYLEASHQLGAQQETVDRATEFMMAGYERQLSYQRADGSFSAFGERDAFGSTWLSAFVLRCFLQARPFMDVDHMVLQAAAAFLSVQQGADGRFEENGRVIHSELQGGLDGPTSLTAYVLTALLQDDGLQGQFSGQVTSALIFLETRLALGVSSNYSLGLLTYALALAGSSSANDALDELIGRAHMDDGVPMWTWADSDSLSTSWQPRSAELELASYVLLTLQRLDRAADGVQLARWLSRQRNHGGGFGSTQDTVVALQALASFAALMATNHDVTVKVNSDVITTVATFHIHPDNQMLQQSQQIEAAEPLDLVVTAEGHGLALVQLNVFYNVRSEEQTRGRSHGTRRHEAFHLHVELNDVDLNSAHLLICASLQRGIGLNATGMAVVEAYLPSGFGLAMPSDDLIDLHHYYQQAALKKVETAPGKVILYLDSVTLEEACLVVPMILEVKVGRVQEASVTLYDYYEPRRRAVRTYTSLWRADMSSSSFCGYDECGGSTYHSAAAPLLVNQLPLKLLLLLLHLLLHIHSN